jgi:hypothetical protein
MPRAINQTKIDLSKFDRNAPKVKLNRLVAKNANHGGKMNVNLGKIKDGSPNDKE